MAGIQTVNTLRQAALVRWPKVVLVGDSITQFSFSRDGCWGALLAARLQRKCDIINRGFSGYNTRWARLILPRLVNMDLAKDISAMTIFLGTNDSSLPTNPRRHVPLDEYVGNLVDMVDYLTTIGIGPGKVIFISPPPCDEAAFAKDCKKSGRSMTKSLALTEKYAEACRQAAHHSQVGFVNLNANMLQQDNWPSFLNDGLHLSAAGSTFLDSLLWPHIEKLTSHLPVILPTYKQVDYENPENTFTDYSPDCGHPLGDVKSDGIQIKQMATSYG